MRGTHTQRKKVIMITFTLHETLPGDRIYVKYFCIKSIAFSLLSDIVRRTLECTVFHNWEPPFASLRVSNMMKH